MFFRRRGRVRRRYGRVRRRYGRAFKRSGRVRRRYGRARRRTNTRSSSRSFTVPASYTVSLGLPAGSTAPRGFVPIGLNLAGLPGFGEYEYTYSRVRVLSCTVTVAAVQNGTEALPGGYAIAPSYDMIQSQVSISGVTASTSLLYRNVPLGGNVVGQHFGFKVGEHVLETDTTTYDRATYTGSLAGAGAQFNTTVIRTKAEPYQYRVLGNGEPLPENWEYAPPVAQESNDYQVEVPVSGAAFADLPPVTLDQLSQVKRYRVKFPSTTKRSFKVSFVPYTFLTGSGPVGGLDLVAMPKYFSARRWMPLQWFSVAAGKRPLSLFGPYIAPLFSPADVTQPISLEIYYHVRLQFSGQV